MMMARSLHRYALLLRNSISISAVRASSCLHRLHVNPGSHLTPAKRQRSSCDVPHSGSTLWFGSAHHQLLAPSFLTWSACRTYAKKGKDKGGKGPKKVTLTEEELVAFVDIESLKQEFTHVLEDLKDKFIHQLTVRTSQGVFDNLTVKTPEGNFPLIQLGQVIQKSPQLLTINLISSPQYITHVKEALAESGLNVNPQQDGTSLFIPIPKVTREHRETLAKNAKMLCEKSKKNLRDIYSKYSRKIRLSKESYSSDDITAADDTIKDMMHGMLQNVDEMTASKQQELLGNK